MAEGHGHPLVIRKYLENIFDPPSNSLKDFNASPKLKTTKKKKLGHTNLQHFGVRGCVGASGGGLWQMTSVSIIHINWHKLNNKLINA